MTSWLEVTSTNINIFAMRLVPVIVVDDLRVLTIDFAVFARELLRLSQFFDGTALHDLLDELGTIPPDAQFLLLAAFAIAPV